MLNETQLNILEAYIEPQIETIRDLLPINTILTLKCINDDNLYNGKTEILEMLDIKDVVDELRNIFNHPYPQNRSTTSGNGPNERMAYYKDDSGHWRYEPKGLLSLTAKNDNTAQHVTKGDVIRYFNKLINREIEVAERMIAAQDVPDNHNIMNEDSLQNIVRQNSMQMKALKARLDRLTIGEHLGARNSARSGDVYKLEVKNDAADKKQVEDCDTGMKQASFTAGIGGAMEVIGRIYPPVAPVLLPLGRILAILGTAYGGKKYIDKKVGRTGSYSDVFTMARSSLGENGKKVCDQLLKDIEDHVTKLIIDGAKTIIYDNNADDNERLKKEPNRNKVFATLKAIYESKACPATGIENFDKGLTNAAKIITDLRVMYNASKESSIREPELDILNPHDYFASFKKLSIENREEVIESVNNLLINSFKKLEISIRSNEKPIKIESRVREAKTESCIVM